MIMKFVYVILIFTSLVSGETFTLISDNVNNDSSDININDLVDRFIPEISKFIVNNDLDPLNLTEIEKKLWTELPNNTDSKQVGPMLYKADLVLYSGVLIGLSDLKRYDNAIINYTNRIIKLDVAFEFKRLQGTYNFIVKMVFLNLRGLITASTTNVRAKITVTFNTKNINLSLDKLELQVPSHIKVTITNKDGQTDWMNTFIANVVAPFFKSTITSVFQKEATNAIQKYIDKINLKSQETEVLKILLSNVMGMESALHE